MKTFVKELFRRAFQVWNLIENGRVYVAGENTNR